MLMEELKISNVCHQLSAAKNLGVKKYPLCKRAGKKPFSSLTANA